MEIYEMTSVKRGGYFRMLKFTAISDSLYIVALLKWVNKLAYFKCVFSILGLQQLSECVPSLSACAHPGIGCR